MKTYGRFFHSLCLHLFLCLYRSHALSPRLVHCRPESGRQARVFSQSANRPSPLFCLLLLSLSLPPLVLSLWRWSLGWARHTRSVPLSLPLSPCQEIGRASETGWRASPYWPACVEPCEKNYSACVRACRKRRDSSQPTSVAREHTG